MGRYATRMACLSVAAGVLLTSASTSAQTKVMVLGVRAIEGDDDFTRNLTGALRHEAGQVPGWNVAQRRVSLSQMTLAHGCDEADAGCMTQVARTLEVDRIIYGTVRRTSAGEEYNFSLSLYFFNADTGSIEQSVADDIPRIQSDIDNLRPYARRYVAKFSGQQEQGSLRVDVNVPGAEVRLDGARAGTTDDSGTFIAEDVATGRHRIEISAEGYERFRGGVNVVTGQQAAIEAELAETGDTVVVKRHPISWYTYLSGVTTLVSAGVLAYAGGRTLAIKNGSTFDSAAAATPQSQTVCKFTRTGGDFEGVEGVTRSDVLDLCDEGDKLHVVQWLFGITTAAAGAVTAYLLYRDLSDSEQSAPAEESPSVAIVPSIGPNGGGVSAAVRF